MGWAASWLFADEANIVAALVSNQSVWRYVHLHTGKLCRSAQEYRPFSSGKFCNNGGKVPFLVEGLFEPEECIERCTAAHNCAFVTFYSNGWCQLGSKCVVEGEAGDASAATFAKAAVTV